MTALDPRGHSISCPCGKGGAYETKDEALEHCRATNRRGTKDGLSTVYRCGYSDLFHVGRKGHKRRSRR